MQPIQVLSVGLTAAVPYDSTTAEYWKYHGVIKSACKESRVRLLGASGFCYRASRFCSLLARWASAVFLGNSNYRRIVINPANQKGFGAS